MTIDFPMIDPVAVKIGPLAIHWYALAYAAGIFGGWHYAANLIKRHQIPISKQHLDDGLFWVAMGIILGGRLGYVLFYKPDYFIANPLDIFKLWQGGMSFHGGFLGVLLALVGFCRYHRLPFWNFIDVAACVTPIGLFLGRIANFINGELYGRATNMPWAIIFPRGGDIARHPSQLYEAMGEGIGLFLLLYLLQRYGGLLQRPKMASGIFLAGYGTIRFFIEFFREPDDFLGLLQFGLSMGQWLCLPMIVLGAVLISASKRKYSYAS